MGKQSSMSNAILHPLLSLAKDESIEMPDKFDTYREALIMETLTEWPEDLDHIDATTRSRLANAIHRDPQSAEQIEYIRTHTGFCRKITVTANDVKRVQDQV